MELEQGGPWLMATEGAHHPGERWPLREGISVVGRGAGAEVRLVADGVSRRHVELRREGEQVLARDTGSKNGSRLDGVPLGPHWQLLRHRARLEVGEVTLELRVPAAVVDVALGEARTVTRSVRRGPAGPESSLLVPILGAILFAALAVGMLVWSP